MTPEAIKIDPSRLAPEKRAAIYLALKTLSKQQIKTE